MLKTSILHQLLLGSICFAPADKGGGTSDDAPIGLITLDENLADVEKPPEVRPGTYNGEVQDVQLPTSGKGNQYFGVKVVIPPEELSADQRDGYPDGAVFYWNRTIVPTPGDRRAMYNLRRLVEALGLDSNTSTIDPNEWMGRKVKVRMRMGKYNNEDRAEIAALEAAEAPSRATASGKRGAAASRGRR